MYALVVPTNRPERIGDFLRAWQNEPFEAVIVIEDAPRRTLPVQDFNGRVQVYSWEDIDSRLPHPQVISRRDSAIRAFGFWQAWQQGCNVICTLDDDCGPIKSETPYLLKQHLHNLFRTPRWTSTVPGVRVRGLPYMNLGIHANVMVNVGLWGGHLDCDAVSTLAKRGRFYSKKCARQRLKNRVMPSSQFFPMCGMNLAFRREAACLMYFPPMGQGSPYGRFDDIWCGLILQRIGRHLGFAICTGRPLVWHQRASVALTNLTREAPGTWWMSGFEFRCRLHVRWFSNWC